MTDGCLKPKVPVFNSKPTMGRRMGLVSKPESHPDLQDQDLVSFKNKTFETLKSTSYNSAGTTAANLKLNWIL